MKWVWEFGIWNAVIKEIFLKFQIIWKPVKRSDIAWNFEKFLVGKDGKAFKRYSKSFQTAHIAKDIEALL